MTPPAESELVRQILNLKQGDHLCLFYEKDPAEQMPALVPFIQEGLSRDEQFIYIADDQSVDALASRLEKGGINVAQETDRGRLKLWTRQQWRQPGELSSEKKYLQVQQFVHEALGAGFRGLRFAVEMTWTLGPDIATQQLEHWEATINTIFVPDFPGRILCQYNRSRLAPDVMLAALHTHPLAILGEEVYPNSFYQAPLILNGNGHGHGSGNGKGTSETKVEWMISQLKRTRLADRERENRIQQRAEALSKLAQETNQRLAAIVESSDDAIVSKDLNGIIASWNRGAERLFGYNVEEAVGKSITMVIPQDHIDEEAGILKRIRQGERIEHYETVRRRKDGSLVDISLSVSPVRDVNGKIIGASKIARDITERKRTENALKEAREQLAQVNNELEKRIQERTAELAETNSQLEAFVYSIAHDLRAPLRSMQAFSTMLVDEYAPTLDEKARHYAQRIASAAERMDTLVLDLLAYGRVARSEMVLGTVNVQVGWMAALNQNEQAIREKNAVVQATSPWPNVRAHEATLGQVLANLLSNGLKFVAPGVTPRIRLWAEDRVETVRLWIEDNGIGIAPEHQDRVFRVFERLNPKYPGTGIGLSIVRKGIERMGGRVGLESTLGQGSRFWIELLKA
jgi:PAS domain S-box-containing protein